MLKTIIRTFSAILVFIEVLLLTAIVFMLSNYLIHDGQEKTGTAVTVFTLCFFGVGVILSIKATKKIFSYLLSEKSIRELLLYLLIMVVLVTSSFISFGSFLLLS